MEDTNYPSSRMSATEATIADPGHSSAGDDELELRAGMEVGPYRLLEPVGMGGVGVVYAAYDPRLDRRVALKLLRGGRRNKLEARQRIEREARAMASLTHPNVITVHDVGEFEGQVYLTMEFAEGGTLKSWARTLDLPRTEGQIEQILEKYILAGRGLAAAHQGGLVHRDFKPENVMLGKRGQVMVTDFGLVRGNEDGSVETDEIRASLPGSREMSVEELHLTRTGSVLGTPAFMSPEQHSGLEVGPSSDQFSFCVSLYEALYGERPFSGNNVAALALAVTEGQVREAPRNHRVPERLRKVLLKGLAPTPDARWPSMDALLSELMRTGLRRGFRWPVWFAGGVVALLGVGIIMNVTRPPEPCTGETEAWARAWSAPKAAEVKAAFEATRLPFARASFERVDRHLREYGDLWRASFRDNCEATRVRAVQSDRLMDLRAVCLERRRDQVETLASILVEVDESSLSSVDGWLANVAPLADCEDKAALLSGEHQFELDTPLARELRDDLSRARMLRLGGRYERAQALIDEALKRSTAAQEPVLIVESNLESARLLQDKGNLEAARSAYDEVLVGAIESRQMLTAAHTWADLVSLVGFSQGEPDEARRYAARALAAFKAEGGDHEAGVARVHNGLGLIAYGTARYDEAEAEFKHVLAINERRFGPEHPRTADVLNNLGAIAFARRDYDASEGYHRRCLDIWTKAYGGEHPDIATAHNNLGTIYDARGQLDEALAAYDDALRIRLANLGPEHSSVAMSYYNIGLAYEGKEDFERAQMELDRSVKLFVGAYGAEHKRVATAKTALGRALTQLGRTREAIEVLEAALAVRSGNEVDPADLGETKYGLAKALLASDRSRALSLGREALSHYGEDYPDEAKEVRGWLEGVEASSGIGP